jgi:hypothetical protein
MTAEEGPGRERLTPGVVPTMYEFRYFVVDGGLICYGPDNWIRTAGLGLSLGGFPEARSPPTCR